MSASSAAAPALAQEVIQPEEIVDAVRIGDARIARTRLPRGVAIDEAAGLAVPESLASQVLWTNRWGGLYEIRGSFMPNGDLLAMFPDTLPGFAAGHYAHVGQVRANRMLAFRSSDRGRTWGAPAEVMRQAYNHHGFVPLTPRGSGTVIALGTQPNFADTAQFQDGSENAPIGFRRSSDSGLTWSEPTLIAPTNDPGFQGMIVVRGCETARGTWLIAPHRQVLARPFDKSVCTCEEHILRSADQGMTWTVQPGPSGAGLREPTKGRLEETSLVALRDGSVLGLCRTGTGRLFEIRSHDDGLTWSAPRPTSLVHPYAPAMPFLLEDGRTLAVFHHNAHAGEFFSQDSMACRGQLWVSLSQDGGATWDPPRFLLANALAPAEADNWRAQQCSYLDAIDHAGELHLFLPHRWRRALYLRMPTRDLATLPTAEDIRR